MVRDQPWIGSLVALFEPECKGHLKEVPKLWTDQPLVPIRWIIQAQQTRPYIAEYADDQIPHALYIEDADIAISQVNITVGCAAKMCDSQHELPSPCPALTSDDINLRIMSCKVTSKKANISRVKFRSIQLTQLFVSNEAMLVSFNIIDYIFQICINTTR